MRRALAAATAVLTATAAAAAAAPGARAQQAQPIPVHPDNPAVADQWTNQMVRPGEGQDARIDLLQAPTALNIHDPLKVTLRVTNTSAEPMEGLTVTPRRGPATATVLDQRIAAMASPFDYPVLGEETEVGSRLAPGESTTVELTITEDTLPLPGVGTYPIMFVLSTSYGALLDTERFHISTRGTPEGVRPPSMTALFPVSAPVDIVPGETGTAPAEPSLILASETLADQLAPGGRLSSLLDVFAESTSDPRVSEASCLALDPAVVSVADRMTRGYTVATERPDLVEPPQRLRDSWSGRGPGRDAGVPGRGSADAQAWLDTLTQIAATHCVVALPWANADLNAVANTGDVWLTREAVERGPALLREVLGTTGMTNTVVPGAGYVAPGVPAALGWADHSRSTISDEGMQGPWERAQRDSATPQNSGPARGDTAPSLERGDMPSIAAAAAPPPEQPVRVLVSDNSVTHPGEGRFSWVAPGVMAVTFQDSLGALLATAGADAETAGYSNTSLRFDYTRDSPKARSVNAASAVRLTAQSEWAPADADAEPEPILVNPPATWDAVAAADVMGAVRDLMGTGGARPMTLGDYLAPPAGEPDPAPVEPAEGVGSPFPDPTEFSDAEILTASQQSRFIDELSGLLVSDPSIALSRYGFTLPLRRDLLAALTLNGRRGYTSFSRAQQASSARLAGSRDTLNSLRSGIALIPPGNVYTRTSPDSPLLIVARNGLPLPVDTTIRYRGPDGARLNIPPTLRIPAYGSITIPMTADLPAAPGGTDLQLFLASPSGAQISQPVDISVRTSGVALRGWVILAVLAVFLALLLVFTAVRRRRQRGAPPGQHAPQDAKPPTGEHRRTP